MATIPELDFKVINFLNKLIRTGAIGLNDFLAARNVPNITPECECGWVRQTPKYIVVYCPYLGGREQI